MWAILLEDMSFVRRWGGVTCTLVTTITRLLVRPQLTPSGFHIGNGCCTFIVGAKSKLGVISQMAGCVCFLLPCRISPNMLEWCPPPPLSLFRSLQPFTRHASFLTPTFSSVIFSLIWFLNHTKAAWSGQELSPQVQASLPKKASSFRHGSGVQAMFWYLSRDVWHAGEKRTLCIHQSQTASDRGHSATVARYVKICGNEFQP